ncbi:MAG: hypothetical protein M1813_006765 [Trichoglossum hirsutum]|nr:MAG: hypothetical protein M1813_006765 [Trichoglossum hirsutum]
MDKIARDSLGKKPKVNYDESYIRGSGRHEAKTEKRSANNQPKKRIPKKLRSAKRIPPEDNHTDSDRDSDRAGFGGRPAAGQKSREYDSLVRRRTNQPLPADNSRREGKEVLRHCGDGGVDDTGASEEQDQQAAKRPVCYGDSDEDQFYGYED